MKARHCAAHASALPAKRYTSGYGAWYTPGMNGPNPRRWMALLAVSDSDPSDRPWNAPRNAITPWRFVKYLDSLIAASVVSVPEFAKNVRTSPSIGAMDASSCARRTCGS